MQLIKDNTGINILRDNRFKCHESLKKTSNNLLNKIIRVERYINRPLAYLIVRLVYNTPITPNVLTYFSFFLGLLGAFFLSRGQYYYLVTGGILIQLCAIVDSSDGMLARSKNMCSQYGSHLDIFLARIIDFTVVIGMSIGIYTSTHDKNLLILGILGGGLYLLQVNLFYITDSYLHTEETGQTEEARALMLLLVMICSIADRLDVGIYLLLAETIVNIVVRLIYFIKLGNKNL